MHTIELIVRISKCCLHIILVLKDPWRVLLYSGDEQDCYAKFAELLHINVSLQFFVQAVKLLEIQ